MGVTQGCYAGVLCCCKQTEPHTHLDEVLLSDSVREAQPLESFRKAPHHVTEDPWLSIKQALVATFWELGKEPLGRGLGQGLYVNGPQSKSCDEV